MTNRQKPGSEAIREIITILEEKIQYFIREEAVRADLSGKDRQRLISAKVRNYGFIVKAFDTAMENPQFMPANLDRETLWETLHSFEDLRQLMLVLQQFQQLATNSYMQRADACYRKALRIYGSLREQAKAKIPGAAPVFASLMNFFHRRRRTEDESSETELDKDLNQLTNEE